MIFYFIFWFVLGFEWAMFVFFFVILCFEIGVAICNNPFMKLALHMSWIVIYKKIMTPSMKYNCDNLMCMLCISSHTFLGGWQKFMIK